MWWGLCTLVITHVYGNCLLSFHEGLKHSTKGVSVAYILQSGFIFVRINLSMTAEYLQCYNPSAIMRKEGYTDNS